jgi:hypothetical protein
MNKLVIIILVLSAQFAQAQTTSTASSGSVSEAVPAPSRLKVSYFGDLKVPVSKTEKGEWFHEPGLDYSMDGYTLKFKAPFYTYSQPNSRDRITEIDDLAIGASVSRLVDTKYFSLNAGVNASAPTSYYTNTVKQRTYSLGFSLTPSTKFGTTNWKLDWISLFKSYNYVSNSNLNTKNLSDLNNNRMDQYKIEFYPALSYSISDSFAAVLAGNLEFKQRRNTSLSVWSREENSLHFGFNYKVAKQLSIRPEIRFPNPEKLNSDTANAGVLFFGSL